jgi:hypothetical protein
MGTILHPDTGGVLRQPSGFAPHHPADAWFFPAILGAIWLILLVGFLPETFASLQPGGRAYPLIIHVHAVVFFGWITFLTMQIGLIRTGNVAWHQRMGMVGAALAVAVVLAGPAAALTQHMNHEARQPPQFLALQLGNIVVFAVLVTAGLLLRGQSAAHKRLMLIGTIALIGAGFGRVVRMLTGAPPPWTLMPSVYIAGNILLLVIALYDYRTRGRPHPVFLEATGFFLVTQLIIGMMLQSPAWAQTARQIVG